MSCNIKQQSAGSAEQYRSGGRTPTECQDRTIQTDALAVTVAHVAVQTESHFPVPVPVNNERPSLLARVACANWFIDLDEPDTRRDYIYFEQSSDMVHMGMFAALFSVSYVIGGAYCGARYSTLPLLALAGCICGAQFGHSYYKFLHIQARRWGDNTGIVMREVHAIGSRPIRLAEPQYPDVPPSYIESQAMSASAEDSG